MRTKAWLCVSCVTCPHRFEGHVSQKYGICANCGAIEVSVVWCIKDWNNGTNVPREIPK